MRTALVLGLPLALLLAGCCPDKSNPAPAAAPAPAPTGSTAASAPAAAPSPVANHAQAGVLSTEPAVLRQCDLKQGVGTEVVVRWEVTTPGAQAVKIYVSSPQSDERKLWTSGGASGSETTGPWTFPGTTFVATDAAGTTLGELTMQAQPCH